MCRVTGIVMDLKQQFMTKKERKKLKKLEKQLAKRGAYNPSKEVVLPEPVIAPPIDTSNVSIKLDYNEKLPDMNIPDREIDNLPKAKEIERTQTTFDLPDSDWEKIFHKERK